MLHERRGRDLDNNVVDADLEFRIELVYSFAHFSSAIHFYLSGKKEMRYRAQRSHQALGNGAPHLAGRLVAVSRSLSGGCFLKGAAFHRPQMSLGRAGGCRFTSA